MSLTRHISPSAQRNWFAKQISKIWRVLWLSDEAKLLAVAAVGVVAVVVVVVVVIAAFSIGRKSHKSRKK